MSEPIFFLHFPRTAGTTINEIFKANLPAENIIKIYSKEEYDRYASIYPEELDNIKYITGHLLLDDLNPTKFYGRKVRAFTLLRDPVKRLLSEYAFLKTWKEQHLYSYLNDNNISFIEYIQSDEKILRYRGKNFMTRCLSGESLEKVSDLNASLAKAKFNLINNFWFYGIQERFIESILLLGEKAALKNVLHQKHNSLALKGDAHKPTQEELDIIYKYNSADIELYNFALDNFDKYVESLGDSFRKKVKNFKFLNDKYQKIASLLHSSAYQNLPQTEGINLPKDSGW